MASAVFFNAARSKEIEDNSIVGGLVNASGNLILTKRNGNTIDAGSVKGNKGDQGNPGDPSRDFLPDTAGSAQYIRLGILDGSSATSGAHFQGIIGGLGDRTVTGPIRRSTIMFQAAARHTDATGILVKAWVWNPNPLIKLYYRSVGSNKFELWLLVTPYSNGVSLTKLSTWNTTVTVDGATSTAPSGLVQVTIQALESVVISTPSVLVTGDGAEATPYQLTVRALDTQAIVKGVLENSYRGGPAKVKIGGTLSSEAYNWAGIYNPYKSREVKLLKLGSSYLIQGQSEELTIPLTINTTNFRYYVEQVNDSTYGYILKATKMTSGLVVLGGLLASKAAYSSGTTIATLPVGFRPDFDMMFPIELNDTAGAIKIQTNGVVSVQNSVAGAGSYLSLDGIAFWSAGIAQWTDVGGLGSSYGANFDYNSSWASYGVPGFWKDPYGFVWFKGLVRVKTATTVDNTLIIGLGSTYRSEFQEHHRVTGSALYSGVGSRPADGLVWKANSRGTVGDWISLSSVVLRTAEAQANNPWYEAQVLSNSWAPGTTEQGRPPSYLLREDGLRMLSGFMVSGTIGQFVFTPQDVEMWPEGRQIILSRISNNARARVDIRGTNADSGVAGRIFASQGSNAWFTLDGAVYTP